MTGQARQRGVGVEGGDGASQPLRMWPKIVVEEGDEFSFVRQGV